MTKAPRLKIPKMFQGIFLILFSGITALLVIKTILTILSGTTLDFSVYYLAAEQIIKQKSVYADVGFTLFGYPVVSGLFFIPFVIFPYPLAQNIFLFLNIFCLGGISLLIPYLLFSKRSLLFSVFIFSFAYYAFPTKFTLGMGQSNIIALLLLLLSFFFYLKKRFFLTTLFFAIACMLKPILGFMILFFLLRKEWKILLGITLCLLGGFVVSIIVDKQALSDYLYYITHIVPHLSKPFGREIYYNQSLMGLAFRTFTDQTLRLVASYTLMFSVFITIVLFSLKKKLESLPQFSLLLTALPLLDTLSWQHHFVFLILPFAYGFFLALKHKKLFLLILLCIAYSLVGWNFKHPELLVMFPFSILLSHVVYGTLLLFGVQLKLLPQRKS